MRELTQEELLEVNGGIDWSAIGAGIAVISLGIVVVGTAGLATIPISVLAAATAGELIVAGAGVTAAAAGGAIIGTGALSS